MSAMLHRSPLQHFQHVRLAFLPFSLLHGPFWLNMTLHALCCLHEETIRVLPFSQRISVWQASSLVHCLILRISKHAAGFAAFLHSRQRLLCLVRGAICINSVILSIKLDLDRSTKFSVGSFFSQNGFVFIGAGGDGVVVVVVFCVFNCAKMAGGSVVTAWVVVVGSAVVVGAGSDGFVTGATGAPPPKPPSRPPAPTGPRKGPRKPMRPFDGRWWASWASRSRCAFSVAKRARRFFLFSTSGPEKTSDVDSWCWVPAWSGASSAPAKSTSKMGS